MKLQYINEKYNTIYDVLKNEFEISNRLITKIKKSKKIFLNNSSVSSLQQIKKGDLIEVLLDFDEDSTNIIPTKMPLKILYEDDSLLIVNKSANIAIHPSILHYSNTLSNGVKYYFNEIGLQRKIRPVNRLDRDTSGIVIFAKNEYVQECLIKQMSNNSFKKEYIALCEGVFKKKEGTINAPISRKENSIIERCINNDGEKAITHFLVLHRFSNYTLVQCILETGRTHQIRVHMSYIGHPIIGDTLYGNSSNLINRQALHAYKIIFVHPLTKKIMRFISPIPEDMKKAYEKILENTKGSNK